VAVAALPDIYCEVAMPETSAQPSPEEPPPLSTRSHVLVVTVWFETPGVPGLRARVTATDPLGMRVTRRVAARPAEVVEAVGAWLDALVAGNG
jgi:hypothetical protein